MKPENAWSVAVWNLDEARSRKARAWTILEELRADISLLNEARIPRVRPRGYFRGGEKTLGLDPKVRSWASAVVSPHVVSDLADDVPTTGPFRAPFANARPGSWTAALVQVPDVGSVTAVALYGLLDERSDASVHRSLSDLTPLFENRRYNKRLVLGGDFNTWTGWPSGGGRLARDESVFRRIEAFGLVDCLLADPTRDDRGPLAGCPCSYGDSCRHTRTRIDQNAPEVPYQMDYLYASRLLAERLLTCEALDLGADSPSDHFPIQAAFAK
ncbi:MAG: hypothetical protein ACRD1T_27175 [Acidimicrobiia bacterium]